MTVRLQNLPFLIENIQSMWETDKSNYCRLNMEKANKMTDEEERRKFVVKNKTDVKDLTDKEMSNIYPKASILYISKYCFPMVDGSYRVWMSVPYGQYDYVEFNEKSFKTVYGSKFSSSVSSWFFSKNRNLYHEVCDTSKPRMYSIDGNHCLNTFKGFKYKYVKDVTEKNISEESKEHANIFLNFMKDVLCSGNEEQFKYLSKWIGNILRGNKNDTALYLRGEQGIGKSTFSDMLRYHIVGLDSSICSGSEPLRTANNRILMGKSLVIFEELPTFNRGEWSGVSSTLKDLITNNKMTYAEKYMKPIQANNLNNYILNSNNSAIQDDDGRRYFILDLSVCKKGDHKYFGDLKSKCFNDITGYALFDYFYECVEDDFNAQKEMPLTNNKLDSISDRLHPTYKFIKYTYIENKEDMIIRLKPLYDSYVLYAGALGEKPVTKTKFNAKLKEAGMFPKLNQGYLRFNNKYTELKDIADKNKWIHELDEFQDDVSEDHEVSEEMAEEYNDNK